MGDLQYVLRHRVFRIQEVKWPRQGIEETVGDAPGMSTLAHDDALDAEVEGRLADAQGYPAHVFIAADEHPEISGLAGMRTHGPADAGLVENLAITDQAVDVGFGEK